MQVLGPHPRPGVRTPGVVSDSPCLTSQSRRPGRWLGLRIPALDATVSLVERGPGGSHGGLQELWLPTA